jgi:hypothetical protein
MCQALFGFVLTILFILLASRFWFPRSVSTGWVYRRVAEMANAVVGEVGHVRTKARAHECL